MNYEFDYEEYLLRERERIKEQELYDAYMADVLYEKQMIEREDKMERKIIDLSTTKMTREEVYQLENYVWKDNLLIPQEIVGE